ncbi:MAG: hypothetical protein CBB71_05060 [Rhodopirellula sp. TMED11]|nr:MAG: hypothetical protein CBB71_05060 [Rhodopirellula sp. TMED11]
MNANQTNSARFGAGHGFLMAAISYPKTSSLWEARTASRSGASMIGTIGKAGSLSNLKAIRGGFLCSASALPTTSPSPRFGSTLPQAEEFSQQFISRLGDLARRRGGGS